MTGHYTGKSGCNWVSYWLATGYCCEHLRNAGEAWMSRVFRSVTFPLKERGIKPLTTTGTLSWPHLLIDLFLSFYSLHPLHPDIHLPSFQSASSQIIFHVMEPNLTRH